MIYHKLNFTLCIFIASFITISLWYQSDIYYKLIKRSQNSVFGNDDDIALYYNVDHQNFKYILIWNPDKDPMKALQEEDKAFTKRHCSIKDCYVSSDRSFFIDVSKFDVIVFHGRDVSVNDLPLSRSLRQKYIYANMESADNFPVCEKNYNDFFNWTWTYKLNSDISYAYISIRNKKGVEIGPQEVMHWKKIEDMDPINEGLVKKLSTKKDAAAWFVSHCSTRSKRETIAAELKIQLEQRGLSLDVYGNCGKYQCPRSNMTECFMLLETTYYFYLSFENSFSSDYVTEKLLHALQHYTVPIVFGGANYTRFMPDGIYLNARDMSVPELADKMAEIINDKNKYYSYFKWHNHYSYHSPANDKPDYDLYCKMCRLIHDQERFNQISRYENFTDYWNTRRC